MGDRKRWDRLLDGLGRFWSFIVGLALFILIGYLLYSLVGDASPGGDPYDGPGGTREHTVPEPLSSGTRQRDGLSSAIGPMVQSELAPRSRTISTLTAAGSAASRTRCCAPLPRLPRGHLPACPQDQLRMVSQTAATGTAPRGRQFDATAGRGRPSVAASCLPMRCRRRDSNSRHADYDSAALTD